MSNTNAQQAPIDWDCRFAELRGHLEAGGTMAAWGEVDPAMMDGMYTLGRYFYEHDDYDNAGQLFAWIVGMDPYNRDFTFSLGATRQMQGRYEDALEWLATSLAFDITDPAPAFHMAQCLLKLGKGAEAREMLEISLNYAKEETHPELRGQVQNLLSLLPVTAAPAAK